MANKVLLTTLTLTLLFLTTGTLHLGLSLLARSQADDRPLDGHHVIRLLLQDSFPLAAGMAGGALILATAACALVGLLSPMTGGWLRTSGYMVVVCGLVTLGLGTDLWIMTLRLRDGFFATYLGMKPEVQSLVQQSFQCCGYYNATTPAFITDPFCSSPAAAALVPGCAPAVSAFANTFLDRLFASLFAMVGLDAILVLSIACLLKDRRERERYRNIDEKSGFRTI